MSLNRFMIAAPASGSGKTLVTCGILQALVNRKLKVASFKCGPDYIDPMFHARVIGTKSRNMDCFFCDDETLRYLFTRTAESSDISVIEGVMGFYDGMRAASTDGSSYDVSQKLKAPVILLVNCRGASVSCIPVIKGFKEFRENNIKGVILNSMSPHVFAEVKPAIEKELGLKVIGYVPKLKDINLESRHLGLVLPDEVASLKEDLNRLAGILEETLDFDALLEIAAGAPEISGKAPEHGVLDKKVRIGLASDDTFCFTYEDNIALLEECGAEIVPFSPITEQTVTKIFDIHMKGLLKLLDEQNITLELTDEARKAIAMRGFNQQYGARPILGIIRKELRHPISKMIISGKIKSGDHVTVSVDKEGNVKFDIWIFIEIIL
jgi:cobyrinic acid a,c-diamide synthase